MDIAGRPAYNAAVDDFRHVEYPMLKGEEPSEIEPYSAHLSDQLFRSCLS